MNKINKDQFIDKLISAFPEIKEEVSDEDYMDSIGLQVGCFTRFTQKVIDNNVILLISECFEFVNSYIDIVEFDVENSLSITWLAKLNFDNNKEAYSLLPLKLRTLYDWLQQQYSAPLSDKVKNFLSGLDKE
jgi:hypothetical protein